MLIAGARGSWQLLFCCPTQIGLPILNLRLSLPMPDIFKFAKTEFSPSRYIPALSSPSPSAFSRHLNGRLGSLDALAV